MSINLDSTLADLVIEDGRRSRVLERFDLDYCCNGHQTLGEAITAAGLEETKVVSALDLPPAPASEQPKMPAENAALAHEIVDTHHAYMWEEMPRLKALVEKVHGVHGDRHPELAEVLSIYTEAVAALDPHMTTEERVVFPAISRMERTGEPVCDGSFAGQIDELRAEHDAVGDLFKRLRAATNAYAVPEDACNSYRMMLEGLEHMERDLHEHIHKENNVLFPRVLELEQQVSNR